MSRSVWPGTRVYLLETEGKSDFTSSSLLLPGVYTPFLFLHGPCSVARRSRPRKRPNGERDGEAENKSYSLSFARVNTARRLFGISWSLPPAGDRMLSGETVYRLKYVNCVRVSGELTCSCFRKFDQRVKV